MIGGCGNTVDLQFFQQGSDFKSDVHGDELAVMIQGIRQSALDPSKPGFAIRPILVKAGEIQKAKIHGGSGAR